MTIHTPKTRRAFADLLRPCGLTPDIVEIALGVGAAESRTYGPGAPKAAPEYNRWARTIEALHGGLMTSEFEWERFDPKNLPFFLLPGSRLGLLVSSGNQFTGVAYANPSNRNPKGVSFGRLVDDNGQMSFFGTVSQDGRGVDAKETWVLLYQERGDAVHAELSLPVSMPKGHVRDWRDRIIFPIYDVATSRFLTIEDDQDGDEFAFKIARR